MQEKYYIGNAQTIGSYEIQSNYFSTISNFDTVFAVLADGTIDHINGRGAAILAVETSIHEFLNKSIHLEMEAFFETLTQQIMKNIKEKIYLDKTPNVSLSIVSIEREELFYYTVGDNKLFLSDGKDYKPLIQRKGQFKIKKKDVVGIVSKGVCEALNEIELLEHLSKNIDPYDKAQFMIESVNRKNTKLAKNSTIILIEGAL